MKKIYTKTGDKGSTSLLGGKRISKADRRIDAYGTIDELNAFLGLARSFNIPRQIDRMIGTIQEDLFLLGAELASDSPSRLKKDLLLSHNDVLHLEKMIDTVDGSLPPLRNFIVPGGDPAASMIHTSRAVCRRAERLVVGLSRTETVRDIPVIYLNRLSDLLFVLARKINVVRRKREVIWKGRSSAPR